MLDRLPLRICILLVTIIELIFGYENNTHPIVVITAEPKWRLRLFQAPPQPLEKWPEILPLSADFQQPLSWNEKTFGQWCRNFTVNKYTCCGDHNVECCGGPQTWVYFIFGVNLLQILTVFIFYLLLHFDVILPMDDHNSSKNSDSKRCGALDKGDQVALRDASFLKSLLPVSP